MSPDKLIYMANQIGKFFAPQSHDKAVAGISDHLRKFWEPSMREKILRHLDAGGDGLDPLVKDAVRDLARPQVQKQADLAGTDKQAV